MDFDELQGRRGDDGDIAGDPAAQGGYELSLDKPDEGFGFDDETPTGEYELPDEPASGGFEFSDEPSGGTGEPQDEPQEDPGVFGYEAETEVSGEGFSDEPIQFREAGSTSFFGFFAKGFRMAMLKGDAAEDVAADPKAFVPALVIIMLPSFVVGLLMALLTSVFSSAAMEEAGPAAQQMQAFLPLIQKFALSFVVVLPLVALISALVGIGILHLLAKLLKGEGSYLDYFQTMGVGSLISWGGLIPYIGILFSLWTIPVMVVITSRVHNLSTGRAVAVVLLPLVLIFVAAIALFSTIIMAMLGAGGMEGMQGM